MHGDLTASELMEWRMLMGKDCPEPHYAPYRRAFLERVRALGRTPTPYETTDIALQVTAALGKARVR